MRGRPDPEAVSPRALARLRGGRGGWVPTADTLSPGPAGPAAREASVVRSPAAGPSAPAAAVGPGVGGPSGGGEDAVGRHRRTLPGRGWLRAPAAVVGARWQPGRAAVLGVVLVTVVAVLVLGLRVAWATSGSSGDVLAPGGGARAGPTGVSAGAAPVGVPAGASPGAGLGASPTAGAEGGAAAEGDAGSAGGAGGVLVVHVVGQVAEPGVQRLPVGARVADALEAAGGATRKADLAAVNLARLLVDGEQVRVPEPGEVLVAPPAPGGGGGSAGGAGGGSAGGAGAAGTPVPLNTADVAAFDTLPGIGPVLAQRIVDWRSENGRFTSVDELAEVSGIGEKLLARLRPLVTT